MKCRIFTRSVMALSFCFLLMSSTGVLAQYKGNPVKKEKLVKVIRMKQLSTREIVAAVGVRPPITDHICRSTSAVVAGVTLTVSGRCSW